MAALTVTNITQGNVHEFVAEFVDANGIPTLPSGATLNITYPIGPTDASSSPTTTSTSITMTKQNNVFTATWSSCLSALGNATWNVSALGSTTPSATGTLRILTP
jgi:hypothetical protein